jgi:small subunit ribosomal protein S6
MPFYETTFIARQDLSGSDVEKLTDTFKEIVTEEGGEVLKVENWGLRNLAYLVKKNRKGHYVHLIINSTNAALERFRRIEQINEDVLRLSIIKTESPNLEEGTSLIDERK